MKFKIKEFKLLRTVVLIIFYFGWCLVPINSYAIDKKEAENNALEYSLKLQGINTSYHKNLWKDMWKLRGEMSSENYNGEKNLIKFLIQKYDLDPINKTNDHCQLMERIVGYIVGGSNFGGMNTVCVPNIGCAKYYSIISNEQFGSLLKYGEGEGEGSNDNMYLITDKYSRPIGVWSSFSKSFSIKKGAYQISQNYKKPESHNELSLLLPIKNESKINKNSSYLRIDNCYVREINLKLNSVYID